MVTRRDELRAGLFVLAALSLLCVSILVMGRERQLFVDQIAYSARVVDTKGLATGAPIRLGGIKIGRIGSIEFPRDASDPEIRLHLLINEPYTDRLREDSTLSIETQGLLGDRFVSISGGRSEVVLSPGSEIGVKESQELGAVLGKVQTIVEDTSTVAKDLTSITGKVKEEGVDKLVKAFESFNRVIAEVEQGKGFAHEVVYGSTGKDTIQDLRDAAKNLKDATADVRELVHRLKGDNGILMGLLGNESGAAMQRAVKNIGKATEDIAIVSDALAHGTGTVGALIMDSTLYDNTVQLTDEAKRSVLLRQAIRSAMKSAKRDKDS
jgi:phospholipid/cholesterol/gamma-HCH transport system substrate-binding protein